MSAVLEDVIDVGGEVVVVELGELSVTEYTATAAGLADLRMRMANVVFDLTTKDGDKAAREARRECVKLRTALEASRKSKKAALLEQGRKLDGEAAALVEAILKIEKPIDDQILAKEAEDKRKAEERKQAESDRIDAIQKRIGEIRAAVLQAVSLSIDDLDGLTASIDALAIDESFAEFAQIAQRAKDETLTKLADMHDAAVERERVAEQQRAEAARLKAEREAFEAEQAQARLQREEADRIAQAQRDADQRLIDAQLEELRVLREAQAEQERVAREAEEARAAEAAAEAARVAKEEADRAAAVLKAERDAAAERERLAEEARAEERRIAQVEADRARAAEARLRESAGVMLEALRQIQKTSGDRAIVQIATDAIVAATGEE